jgi:ABC-2 type transport system ATP-binding protein
MASEDALRFSGVVKRFGKTVALAGLDAQFPRGSLVGLVGPNGAGKTTAFSLVGGFLRQDEGEVDILGEGPFDAYRLKGRLGLLPQDAELGNSHTPRELLTHLARLQGMSSAGARAEVERVIGLVRLADRARWRIGKLSHGMRRRVAVASALLGDPPLVMLDEPTAGLDPAQAASLRDVLSTRRPGQTVIISSHNLLELELICDHVVMMDRGRCVRQGPIGEVTGRHELVEWELAGEAPLAALQAALPDHEFSVEGALLRQGAPAGADLDAASVDVMRVLVGAGVALREVRRGVGLERRFLADQADGEVGR